MKSSIFSAFILLILIVSTSCKKVKPNQLEGKWIGTELKVNGKNFDSQANLNNYVFYEDESFAYNFINGTWNIDKKKLHLSCPDYDYFTDKVYEIKVLKKEKMILKITMKHEDYMWDFDGIGLDEMIEIEEIYTKNEQ